MGNCGLSAFLGNEDRIGGGIVSTPQIRSRDYLTKRGWTIATVEALKRFPQKGIPPCHTCGAQKMVMVRTDLFGFGDILAFNSTNVMIVQSTTRHNMLDRWKKIAALDAARLWVSGTGIAPTERLLEIHGWYQDGRFWKPKIKLITSEDFERTRCADFDDQDEESLP